MNEQFSGQELHTSTELLKSHPEVLSNPRLDHTKTIISVPTYHGEWKNGVLVRNLISILSQNLQDGEALEVNYVFNMNGDIPAEVGSDEGNNPVWRLRPPGDEYWEKRKIADEAVVFLKKIVQIQSNPETNQDLVQSETDPLKKKVLELAAQNYKKVAVSVVNTLDLDVSTMGYQDQLSGFRTMGLDYAEARLDDDGIFLIFDTDAVPQDNQFAHNLHALFNTNPDTKYILLRLGYQTSGVSKKVIESSIEQTFKGIHGYSTSNYTQTTQMAFRKEVFGRLKEIMDLMYNPNFLSIKAGQEDRDTALRLIGLYADMVDGMLFTVDRNVGNLPVSLVEDRLDGLFDGVGRAKSLEHEYPSVTDQIVTISKMLEETKERVRESMDNIEDDGLRMQLQRELELSQKDFLKKQTRNLRFNRGVAKDFLKLLDQGGEKIQIGSHEWIEDLEIKKHISEMPNGTALLAYLNRNKELIDELTSEDITLMRYCIDPAMVRPSVMDHLNDFQKAMIEYLGYVDPANSVPVPKELQSSLQPMIADLMAYTHVLSLHQLSKDFYRDNDPNQYIRYSDQRMREEILNYQAVQEGRDKSWLADVNRDRLGEEGGMLVGEKMSETITVVDRIFGALSPKFSGILRNLKK